MKEIDPEKFQNKIDRKFVWRKKELLDLSLEIQESLNSKNIEFANLLYKSAYVLLYAHWEGFIKESSNFYLQCLNSLEVPLNKLPPCFLTLHFIKDFYSLQKQNNYKKTAYGNIVTNIINIQNQPFFVPKNDKEIIETKSNLNYSTLEQILFMINIDSNPFKLQERNIDSNLLDIRNRIAHGEYYLHCNENDKQSKFQDFLDLRDILLNLLELFREELINSYSTIFEDR